jgi:hypothetical protein
MPVLTRAQALKCKRFKKRKVPLPELGKDYFVYVRTFSAKMLLEMQHMQEVLGDTDAKAGRAMAGSCILGVCDAKGQPIFTLDDVDALQEWPFAALVRCANAVTDLNTGMVADAETARKKSLRRRKSSSRSGSRRS